MHNILLTIFCSTSIALILKLNDSKNGKPIILLSGNYFLASSISLILLLMQNETTINIKTLLFGILMGLFFVSSFFLFAKAVNTAGTSLATISSRLSVIIPILLSAIIFSEIPNAFQIIGIVVTLITIYLFYLSINRDKRNNFNKNRYFYLIAVLIGIGISDFGIKIFQGFTDASEKNLFLLSIFFSAFVYTILYIAVTKTEIKKSTFYQGMILGIPNFFSSYFLIGALLQIKAIIVYPIVNIGIILLTTLLVKIFWKEKLNAAGKAALASGSFALILLSL